MGSVHHKFSMTDNIYTLDRFNFVNSFLDELIIVNEVDFFRKIITMPVKMT